MSIRRLTLPARIRSRPRRIDRRASLLSTTAPIAIRRIRSGSSSAHSPKDSAATGREPRGRGTVGGLMATNGIARVGARGGRCGSVAPSEGVRLKYMSSRLISFAHLPIGRVRAGSPHLGPHEKSAEIACLALHRRAAAVPCGTVRDRRLPIGTAERRSPPIGAPPAFWAVPGGLRTRLTARCVAPVRVALSRLPAPPATPADSPDTRPSIGPHLSLSPAPSATPSRSPSHDRVSAAARGHLRTYAVVKCPRVGNERPATRSRKWS